MSKRGKESSMDITTPKIAELIELLEKSAATEIEVHDGDKSIRVSRQGQPATAYIQGAAHPVAVANNPGLHQAHPTHVNAAPEHQGHVLRSPMVGTVYLAPNPGAKAFVELGQIVNSGDVLCIVEAMKMMNQIEADKSGKIVARLVENAAPVEFDQPLFIIE